MTDDDAACHHGSHQGLLWSPGETCQGSPKIDAIIVPTARPPAYLKDVAELALTLNCILVTLHSRDWTTAAKAARYLPANVDLIAIDVPESRRLRLPDWDTSRLLAGSIFARKSDLSIKRNLALSLSHMLDWSRIIFLDDDIIGLSPADVGAAIGLLGSYNAVGLRIGGFPDHSVVCHAFRQAGGEQQSFVGGGALAVQVERARSFFPDIYNDDWFFLLDGDKQLQPIAITGEVIQRPYDPFRNPERARAEELGDVLAEGLYWLLDQERSIIEADRAHWVKFLARRKRFIEGVLEMVRSDNLDEADRARRIEALKGSLGRLTRITPELCERYLQAWMSDQPKWHEHLHRLPAGVDLPRAIALLARPGAPRLTWQARRRASLIASRRNLPASARNQTLVAALRT